MTPSFWLKAALAILPQINLAIRRAFLATRRIILVVLIAIVALTGWWYWNYSRQRSPDYPAILTQVRETMKLETLDITLYKRVDFRPERMTQDTALKEVYATMGQWLRPSRGRAIVFAKAHLSYDLSLLNEKSFRVLDRRVELALPPPQVRIEILPAELEVIDSNLDMLETGQLLEHVRNAMLVQLRNDLGLRKRARLSAEKALKALLYPLGFQEVVVSEGLVR